MAAKMIFVFVICLFFIFDFGHGMPDGPVELITDHPYMVTIEMGKMYRCSGVILNPYWVLTAAQCISNIRGTLRVRAGTAYRNVLGELIYVSTDNLFPHPDFKIDSFDYDIGLIKLDTPFNFSTSVSNITGVASSIPLEGTLVTMVGWGSPTPGTWLSQNLLKTEIPLVYRWDCVYNYQRLEREVTNSMFCAGEANDGACGGDTGDPLFYGEELIGIMSWSYGCGERNYPAVFASAYNVSDWIYTTVAA